MTSTPCSEISRERTPVTSCPSRGPRVVIAPVSRWCLGVQVDFLARYVAQSGPGAYAHIGQAHPRLLHTRCPEILDRPGKADTGCYSGPA